MRGNQEYGIPLDWKEVTLPAVLGTLGYRTHSIGKIHMRPPDIPRGSRLTELDPKEFPESREMWNAGRLRKFPEPYYGFQTVDFIGGHGDYTYGDYLNLKLRTLVTERYKITIYQGENY